VHKALFGLSLALLALGFAGSSTSATAGTTVAAAGKPVASCTKAAKIFYGDDQEFVITMNPDQMNAQAVAVCKDGTIADVGDRSKLFAAWRGPDTELVALHRPTTLLPGFVEPHTHLTLTIQSQLSVPCGSQKPNVPITTVLARLQAAAKAAEDSKDPNPWVVGTDFDPSRSDPLFASLDAETLDKVSKTIPILVMNASTHIAYVNTAAMAKAKPPITADTTTPGVVKDTTKYHKPTGQLNEVPAMRLVSDQIPTASKAVLEERAACVIQQWAAAGVTTSTEIALGIATTVKSDLDLYNTLLKKNGPIRFRVYVPYNLVTPDADGNLRTLPSTGDKSPPIVFKRNEGDDRFKVLGVKFVTDGSTQGFTAAVTQPYLDPGQPPLGHPPLNPEGWKGTSNFPSNTTPTLLEAMRTFYKPGWQLAAHANGDDALEQVLQVYETLKKEDSNLPNRRLRIEHFTVTNSAQTPSQLEQVMDRVYALGVTPGMTAGHLYYWGQVFYESILGPKRANQIHPSNSLYEKGIRFAYHSDSPVTKVEPLRYVQTEATRVTQLPLPGYPNILGEGERISVEDALSAVTLDAAYQVFFDDKVGSLQVGKLADFVVLDSNPLDNSSTIADIQVLATYLGGELVYKKGEPLLCPPPPSE
jgi:predicted amidohydrolase YtcJ